MQKSCDDGADTTSVVDTSSGTEVWPVPTDASGRPQSGSVVDAESGVYFVGSSSMAQLAVPG